jgi:hypothetical protein
VAFVAASAIITRSAVSGATSASGFRFAPGTAAPLLLISLVWALYNGGCLILSSFVPAFFVAHGMSLALADGLPYPGEAAWYVVSAGSMSRHMKPRGAAGAALPRKMNSFVAVGVPNALSNSYTPLTGTGPPGVTS